MEFSYLECIIQYFIYSQTYENITVSSKLFITPHLPCKNYPLTDTLHSLPHPHPLTTSNLLSVCVDLPTLDISYKWNDTVFWTGFFDLA